MIFRIFLLGILLSSSAIAKVNVITTTTDLAWIVGQIGKSKVKVESLLDGTEDPHYVDAVPQFIRKVADAQVVCLVGLDLEVGWIGKVLSRSRNAQVQPGGKGYCDVGAGIQPLEKKNTPVDRSMGDVHSQGNPHYHLSPDYVVMAAKMIAKTLRAVDPVNSASYTGAIQEVEKKMASIKEEIKTKFSKKKPLVVQYHKEFTYFLKTFDLMSLGAIEEIPGVPPSAARLAQVSKQAREAKVRLALAATHNPEKVVNRFSKMADIPVARVPISINKKYGVTDYNKLLHRIADEIVSKSKSE